MTAEREPITLAICSNRSRLLSRAISNSVDLIRTGDGILVVMDGATGEIETSIWSQSATVLVNGVNRGLAYSRNRVLKECETRFVIFVDDDVTATCEAIESARASLLQGADIVGARIVADHPSHASRQEGRAPSTLEHPYVQGSALFARAEVLRRVGAFDEVFHTYYEEVDLCRRVRWAGWRVALAVDHGIQHKGGGGAGQGRYRRVQMRRNRYYYLFTDVEWRPVHILRLAARWLGLDLRGRSVGGQTTPLIGTVETVGAAIWLALRLPQVLTRRRRYRRLRSRTRSRVHEATPSAALGARMIQR